MTMDYLLSNQTAETRKTHPRLETHLKYSYFKQKKSLLVEQFLLANFNHFEAQTFGFPKGKTMVFLGKTLVFLSKTMVFLDKTLVFLGTTLVFLGKTLVFLGKTMVFLGKTLVFLGKTLVFLGKTLVFLGKTLVFLQFFLLRAKTPQVMLPQQPWPLPRRAQ